MFIDVNDLRKSPGYTLHYDFNGVEMPLFPENNEEVSFKSPLDLSLDVTNTGRVLVLEGRIKTELELVCGRCLEKYAMHLETDFREQFCHVSDVAAAAEEGQNTEDMHIFEGNRISLNEIIDENLLLAVPLKAVCSEVCKGLCPVCGVNLNETACDCSTEQIDPRLEALKDFFKK